MFDKYVKKIELDYQEKELYIYGAGKAGSLLYHLLQENGLGVKGFCVSDLSANKNDIEGVPVYQFDQLRIDPERMVFLIGILERGKKNIRSVIEGAGGRYIEDIPENLLDYDEEEYKRKRRPTMEITPKIGCSVNCRYCPQKLLLQKYYGADSMRKNQMTLEEYKSYLRKLPQNTLIEWAGYVEPFLNPQAADMMLYTHEQGYEQTLFTTLVGATHEDLEKVIGIPFKVVCLHTPDENNYANISVTEDYLHHLKYIVDARRENGDPFVTTANCQSVPHPKILPITAGKIKIYCEMSDRAGNLEGDSGNMVHFHKNGRIWCDRAAQLNHNVLLPDGTVVLCCNDFGLKHVLGNLGECDYEDLMKSEMMRNVKRALTFDDSLPVICRKCIFAVPVNGKEN